MVDRVLPTTRLRKLGTVVCLLILFGMAAISGFFLAITTPAYCAPQSMWIISQFHHHLGHVRIFIARSQVKIVSDTSGFEVLSSAPTWRILLFRPDSKISFDESLATFKRQGVLPVSKLDPDDPSILLRIAEETKLGVNLLVYREKTEPTRVWFWEGPDIDPKISLIIRSFYHLYNASNVQGILIKSLRVSGHDLTLSEEKSLPQSFDIMPEGRVTWVDTTQIKRVPYRASTFQAPAGLHSAKSSEEVLLSSNQVHALEGLMDDMQVGSKRGK